MNFKHHQIVQRRVIVMVHRLLNLLSLLDHHQWLSSMTPWLIGCHLHDVIWPEREQYDARTRISRTAVSTSSHRSALISPERSPA